jgi:eukaryotic-like serine/threonine-protein kinase
MSRHGRPDDAEPVRVWQPVLDYTERWTVQRSAGSGGQGRGYVVSQAGDLAAQPFFLKELKDQSNPQRRARMFREAAALESYAHPRIPRLVESNAQLYGDCAAKLYLVTEFIRGETLAKRRRRPFAFNDAIDLTDQLAETVAYLQTNDAIHRDIKPDNIILRHGEVDAVLVDYGLAFNQSDEDVQLTGDWEELGNRFLRVPELASYSTAKQDVRTDIAFLAGILFYCLVGEVPAVLEDADGRLPHQRPGIDLGLVTPDTSRTRALGRFFDRGFQPRLNDRFPTIEAFRDRLSTLRHPPVESPDYLDILIGAGRLREGD